MDAETLALINIALQSLGLFLSLVALSGMWGVFRKAERPGWASIVPFYNQYVLTCEVARLDPVWFYVQFLPAAGMMFGFVFLCCAGGNMAGLVGLMVVYGLMALASVFLGGVVCGEVARRFNKGVGFGVGLVALPYVFWPMLGFGEARYIRNLKPPKPRKLPRRPADNDDEDDEEDRPRRKSGR